MNRDMWEQEAKEIFKYLFEIFNYGRKQSKNDF